MPCERKYWICKGFVIGADFGAEADRVSFQAFSTRSKYNAAEKGARNHAAKGCESVEVPSVSLHLAITFATDFVLQLNGWAT